MTPELAARIDAALELHPGDDGWEELCVATVRLTRAFVDFDRATKKYIDGRRKAQTRSEQT